MELDRKNDVVFRLLLANLSTMFAVIVAGRSQTNFAKIPDKDAYAFEIPDADSINHIVVFLTSAIGNGQGAIVHFQYPGKESKILGTLSNNKPSAIFRLRGTAIPSNNTTSNQINPGSAMLGNPNPSMPGNPNPAMLGNPNPAVPVNPTPAMLGIELTNLAIAEAKMADIQQQNKKSSTTDTSSALVSKSQSTSEERRSINIGLDLYNFISSYIHQNPQNTFDPTPVITPAQLQQALDSWKTKFDTKLKNRGVSWLDEQP